MAGKTKPGKPVKGINIKLKMINDLMDVTGSAKDSWNPAEISDDMKAIAYIHDLADTWNPAQLNEALKYLGFATIDSWNPAIIEETKNKLVQYFLPTDASGNPIELDLKGVLPYEVTVLTIGLLPIQDLSHGEPSPTNICPISGRTEVNLTVADSETSPTQTETYTETLGQTVYGGKVDFVNGGATSEYALVDMGDLTWVKAGSGYNERFQTTSIVNPLLPINNTVPFDGLCECYPLAPWNYFDSTGHDNFITLNSVANVLAVRNTSYSDTDDFKASVTGLKVCYKKATPTTISTSAEEIELLKGQNVIWTDGDNIVIEYKALLNS